MWFITSLLVLLPVTYGYLNIKFPVENISQETIKLKIKTFEVGCDKNGMNVIINFRQPFDGVIYSVGFYNRSICKHGQGDGTKQFYNFNIPLDECGTKLICETCNTMENIIIIQTDESIKKIEDSAIRIICKIDDYLERSNHATRKTQIFFDNRKKISKEKRKNQPYQEEVKQFNYTKNSVHYSGDILEESKNYNIKREAFDKSPIRSSSVMMPPTRPSQSSPSSGSDVGYNIGYSQRPAYTQPPTHLPPTTSNPPHFSTSDLNFDFPTQQSVNDYERPWEPCSQGSTDPSCQQPLKPSNMKSSSKYLPPVSIVLNNNWSFPIFYPYNPWQSS